MSNELMVPEGAAVPAYIQDAAARASNEEMGAGISAGFPARVKLSGKQFSLVDSAGEETPYPPSKLQSDQAGNVYMPMFVLRAKAPLQKQWFAAKYNPNDAEHAAPDCFSTDGLRPDATATGKQAESCAICPHNAFGSGVDQAGNAAKGKACSDSKVLAVVIPEFGIYSFKIPPASLKNFRVYVDQLTAANIPLNRVQTLVGFDLTATFPILMFRFASYLPEALVPRFIKFSDSPEVREIIDFVPTAAAVTQAVVPAAAVVEPAPIVADADLAATLGLIDDPAVVTAAAVVKEPAVAKEAPAAELIDPGGAATLTDAELAKQLNL